MTYMIPLPASVRDLVNKHRAGAAPGLLLDKYLPTWDPQARGGFSEGVQREALTDVAKQSQAVPRGLDFGELLARRGALLAAVGAARFTAAALGPLTLHLSRASALENAGICLNPLYGFVYLPGSGLKGMARAYAETVWFPAQFRAADGQPAAGRSISARTSPARPAARSRRAPPSWINRLCHHRWSKVCQKSRSRSLGPMSGA